MGAAKYARKLMSVTMSHHRVYRSAKRSKGMQNDKERGAGNAASDQQGSGGAPGHLPSSGRTEENHREYVDAEVVESSVRTEIVPLAQTTDLHVAREPGIVLAEAQRAAKALQEVIESKPDKVRFNGKTYLTFEDWQTVGRFYGIAAKVVSTTLVEYGDIMGFEARAVAVRTDTGLEISGAEAMCLKDEQNWKSKPMFQLKSMAQTRACAKALRNVLAFVPVLAGYEPTPAEEMLERGSAEAAQEVRRRKVKEAKKRGKSAPIATTAHPSNGVDAQKVVFIVGFPDNPDGDIEVTGPVSALNLVGLKRKIDPAPVGKENHRLVKYDMLTKFYDTCRDKGITVKDLSVRP
jgi:hypothetical protein